MNQVWNDNAISTMSGNGMHVNLFVRFPSELLYLDLYGEEYLPLAVLQLFLRLHAEKCQYYLPSPR